MEGSTAEAKGLEAEAVAMAVAEAETEEEVAEDTAEEAAAEAVFPGQEGRVLVEEDIVEF